MAVYDEVVVCNMALSRIGIGQRIDDLSGGDDLSAICNDWYTICRDRVLSAFAWPLTKRRVTLGLVREITESDDVDREWIFSYRYPVDCIVFRRIVSTGWLPESAPIPFDVGQDDTGRLIYCDEEDAIGEYTATYEDPGQWPDALADAVSALLASEIAGPLRVSADKHAMALQLYDRAIIRAQGIANQERTLAPPPVSKYVSVRGGSVNRDWMSR